MKTINFVKMNGAGNDFILIDAIHNKGIILTPELIKNLCHRRKGIGADGILWIDKSINYDFELKYYNSDGSLGSLCGNGARCSIKYAKENLNTNENETKFLCNDNAYIGKILSDNNIIFYLSDVSDVKSIYKVKYLNRKVNGSFIDTGSPHYVIFWNDIKNFFNESFANFNIYEFGKKIRYSEEFSPKGTNVNVISTENGVNYIRTYERGVEEETFACGTGTVASAIIFYLKYQKQLPISFITRDKDVLEVNFIENNAIFSKITLTGPAKINYIGSYNF